jgi:hypothetical protein
VAIARQSRFAERAGRGTTSPLPYDPRAAEAAWTLRDTLARWIRTIDADGVQDSATAAMAWRLAAGIDRLRQHAMAFDEIAGAVRNAHRAIDRPPQRVYAGPCGGCGLDLLAKPGQAEVTCRGCGQRYDVAARQQWMRAELDDLLGTPAWCASAARALGLRVTDATVRQWIRRGRIELRPGGLVRAGDVLDRVIDRDTARPA